MTDQNRVANPAQASRGSNGQRSGTANAQPKPAKKTAPAGGRKSASTKSALEAEVELLKAQLAESQAAQKKLKESVARGPALDEDGDKKGYKLRDVMGLRRDRDLYEKILMSVYMFFLDVSKLAAIYKLTQNAMMASEEWAAAVGDVRWVLDRLLGDSDQAAARVRNSMEGHGDEMEGGEGEGADKTASAGAPSVSRAGEVGGNTPSVGRRGRWGRCWGRR
ncbi:hypothetical protein FB451DRAFT_1186358 [Mycena latifolia]|nr:hypothetical protein FB451DRAFT_1186358 [Mycena latifolia]